MSGSPIINPNGAAIASDKRLQRQAKHKSDLMDCCRRGCFANWTWNNYEVCRRSKRGEQRRASWHH
jgi:hypothetical protein